jgi:hypothetical protein
MATRADILSWVEYAATGVELLAVAIIVVAILSATLSYLSKIGTSRRQTYLRQLPVSSRARASLGTGNSGSGRHYPHRCLESTLTNVLVLGLLVLIRTFSSWALILEIEGRWPWQSSRGAQERGTRVEQANA